MTKRYETKSETMCRRALEAFGKLSKLAQARLARIVDHGPVKRGWDGPEHELILAGLIEPYPRDADTHRPDCHPDPSERPYVIAAELGSWWDRTRNETAS